jgi:Cu(I)/Ag(I) efflux system membrane protein CusA/SilA
MVMIRRITEWSLRYRALVLALFVALSVWGAFAFLNNPVDAIPDLTDPQVIVFADWPGHSAQEVEDQVTYPVTTNLQGLPGVRVIRSQSAFGFAMIYALLDDGADARVVRTRILERLNLVGSTLPAGVVPVLGPEATGVGHVFWFTLESATRSLRDLRTLEDWFVRYQLNSVPGVAEVASVGGTVQQYQIDVDPDRLRGFGLALGDVVAAVRASNANVGGTVIESNGNRSAVRGVGLVQTAADLESIALRSTSSGTAVRLSDVATVKLGDAFRSAALINGGKEAVGGVVVARADANTREVIAAIKARIAEIQPGLPPDVTIVPFYDRSELIDRSVQTLEISLLEEILLVTLAHLLFLRHLRSVLIVTLPLPLAVLVAFLGMSLAGMTSNIMSLAGIAIAIGVLVDAGIVVTENAFRFIETRGVDTRDRNAVWLAVRDSTRLVGRPVFFAMAIILLAFVPVFALTGQEGRLFHPLAFTKTLAVLAATVMAVTLVPVLCTWLIRGRVHGEEDNPVMRAMRRIYQPLLNAALDRPLATLLLAAVFFGGSLVAASHVGREFMPPLNEGDLLFMPIADPSISLPEATRLAERENAALKSVPEVATVVAKVGRADTATDPSPLNMTETLVHLKPREQWRPGMTLDRIRSEMTRAVETPGVTTIWTMPIINRIDMLSTGVRTEVGVKIYGADLRRLDELAQQVAGVVRGVRGASNVYPEPLTSGQYLDVRVRRDEAARLGLSVNAVEDVVSYAIGETTVGAVIDGRQRFPIRVRFDPAARDSAAAIAAVLVTTPSGQRVPLSQVADVVPARGPAMISSENGLLVATVLLNVEGRDSGGFVADAQEAVRAGVTLPPGYIVGWSGQFQNQASAERRLMVVVPLVLLVIFLLLIWTYHSISEAAHVLLAVPFALSGGLYLVWLLGYNFSVAVWVGFIALFGTAVQTAVVMVIYLEEAVSRKRAALGDGFDRRALREAVIEGALLRLRPKIMTVSTVIAGLLPIMWSQRVGAEVMRPLATPVLGGMVSSLAHVLIVTPLIFFWMHARALPKAERPRARSPRRLIAAALVVVAGVSAFLWIGRQRASGPDIGDNWPVVRREVVGDVAISIRSESGAFQPAATPYVVEFKNAGSGRPLDVSGVSLGGAMAMPGMTMTSAGVIAPARTAGRFVVRLSFGMSGTWQMKLTWRDAGGDETVTFDGEVQ